MKISIITPAWNAADCICDTIASVIDQTYTDLEFILVDRGSSDETLATFLSMRHSMDMNRTKHISGHFENAFKAIEKGVEAATGDIIAVLGAGDFFSSDDVVSTVMKEFSQSNGKLQMVYGDMKFVNSDNTTKVTRRTSGRFYRRWAGTSGMTKCHPALFMTKELFRSSGGYRKDFPLAADYEMMVRLLTNRDHTRKYLHKEMVAIRQNRVNSTEAEAYRKELLKAFEVNDISQKPEANNGCNGTNGLNGAISSNTKKQLSTANATAHANPSAVVNPSATATKSNSTTSTTKKRKFPTGKKRSKKPIGSQPSATNTVVTTSNNNSNNNKN